MTAIRKPRSSPFARGLSDRQLAFMLVLPAAILLLVFAVYPFVVAAFDSLFKINLLTRDRSFLGIDNYVHVVTTPAIQQAFVRSVIWTAANVSIQLTIGVAIALLLNAKLRGQTLIRGLVLFPYMVPAVVVALVFRFLFNDLTGLVNVLLLQSGLIEKPISFLSSPATVLWTLIVVNSWKYVPFMVIVILARLQTVPAELYDAAAVDGAGRTLSFRHITLPWIMPVLLVASLLRTIWAAYDFDIPYLLAFGGPLSASTTLPIQIRTLAFGQAQIGLASALAVCVAILLVVAGYLYLRAYRRSEERMA
ncbi:MAG TPA: sugar ABC transporter permease [Candidatus Limnocylindrales bacterium]|jgi:multiple sugar transport system permease protein